MQSQPPASVSPHAHSNRHASSTTSAPRVASWRVVCRRMFFTRHDDMDLGYAFLIPFLLLFLVGWVLAAMEAWKVTVPMWSSLVGVIGTMILATVPKDRARIMKDATLPGDLAHAVATAAFEPHEWADGTEAGVL